VSVALAAAAGALAGAGVAALTLDSLAGARAWRGVAAAAVPLAALTVPASLGTWLARALRLTGPATGGDTTARLAAGGWPGRLGTREWIGLKCCTAAVLGLCAAAGAGSLPGRLPLVALVAAPAAGFVAPEFWLSRLTERRLRAAGTELAPMLDLLQVTVEAGASPGAAMGAVGARFKGPLAAEWRAAATAIALGRPHDEALATLTRHLPSPRVRAFADSMRRARRRGLPLGEVLARQAAAARHEQQIRIRERAARAGPKIQLVVALILVPSVMLIVAAALVAELTAPGVGLTY
jgi:tight adherence protein C